MAATAFIEHRLPGRVRLRIPSRRGDASFFESLIAALSDLLSVDELIANPDTGSIIIRHRGPAESIMSHAADLDLFEIVERELQAAGRGIEPPGQRDTDPRAPEILTAAALVLAGLGTYQLSRGEVLGSATENFWAAFGAYRILDSAALAALFAAFGVYQVINGRLLGSAASLFFYALVALRIAEVYSQEQPATDRHPG